MLVRGSPNAPAFLGDAGAAAYYSTPSIRRNAQPRTSYRLEHKFEERRVAVQRVGGNRRVLCRASSSKRVEQATRRVEQILQRATLGGSLSLASYDLESKLKQQRKSNFASMSLESFDSDSSSSDSSDDSEVEIEQRQRPTLRSAQSRNTTNTSSSISSSTATFATSTATSAATPPETSATVPVASIEVCMGKSCQKKGSAQVLASLQHNTAGVPVTCGGCKCLKQCKRGPAVQLTLPSGKQITYVHANGPKSAAQIASEAMQQQPREAWA